MLKSILMILFGCLAVLLLSNCQIQIKDIEVCGDFGSEGASCFHTNKDGSRDLTKTQWDHERFGMLCTKPENFAAWKAAIIKLCEKNGCTWDQVSELVDKRMTTIKRGHK